MCTLSTLPMSGRNVWRSWLKTMYVPRGAHQRETLQRIEKKTEILACESFLIDLGADIFQSVPRAAPLLSLDLGGCCPMSLSSFTDSR